MGMVHTSKSVTWTNVINKKKTYFSLKILSRYMDIDVATTRYVLAR